MSLDPLPQKPQPLSPLPIDPLLPAIVEGLRERDAVVLRAPPGAGKTTRVPRALYESGVVTGEIVVLEPRRLAARMSALRVAEELGEPVGQRIGYRVRFDEKVSPETRISFVTEGLFLRRLERDPRLSGVGAVLFDEFHERHLQGDVALALVRRLQRERPELKILVMSATLSLGPVAAFLGSCPEIESEGRSFPVEIDYLSTPAELERPLERKVLAGVRQLLRDLPSGDLLVFLPGAAEIRRAQAACAELAGAVELVILHGDLSPAEQDRAIRPGPRRKVIFSTNVAETSITVEGVVAVIDSGLHRRAGHQPWSGLPSLRVEPISRASAAQRAGRAGRLRAGRCLRLYARHDHDGRPAEEIPEVRRSDLAETLLSLASFGISQPARFGWFEPPTQAALEHSSGLLRVLGALSESGEITEDGRRMARLPLHPRLGRMVIEAERRGVGEQGCTLAALLSEGPLRPRRRGVHEGGPDLLSDIELFDEAKAARFDANRLRVLEIDPGIVRTIDRVRQSLLPFVSRARCAVSTSNEEEALRLAILCGYADRVAKRRARGGRELVLSGGGIASLSDASLVADAELLVAVDAEERREKGRPSRVEVRSAVRVEPEWLVELYPERLVEATEWRWNGELERVEGIRRLLYGELVLEERPVVRVAASADASKRLAEAALERGVAHFASKDGVDRLLGRIAFVQSVMPELAWPALSHADVESTLRALCEGASSFAELRDGRLDAALIARIGPERWRLLDELAPERVAISARTVRVEYEADKPPWIASRLQDFFGMREGPKVARGRVPLTLHLLAPNQRAVQVTSDLAGFWERTYVSVRRELCRRYPRHPWPEDPLSARPPQKR